MAKWEWKDTDGYTVTIEQKPNNTTIEVMAPGATRPNSSSGLGWWTKAESVIKPYVIALKKLGKDPSQYRQISGLPVRLSALPFVESVIAEFRAQHDAVLANIPGIDELKAARADEERYSEQFERMMEDENNDGARPPRKVAVSYDTLAVKYPAAAAYLAADSFATSGHYVKASAGRRAKDRIGAGEDYNAVLRDMQAEWSAYCDEHAWD